MTAIDAHPDARSGPQSVVDQVVDALLRLILSNELEPGMPVAIKELSERLQVSHVPVREALRTLEARGLVTFHRGRRPQITPVRYEDFEDVFRLRSLIEGEASSRGIPGHDQLPRLKESLASFERLLEHGDALAVFDAHSEFHRLMLPAASAWERRFLDELWMASERYIQLMLEPLDKATAVETVYRVHVPLIAAVAEGDPDKVRAAVVGHVQDSFSMIADAVRQASIDEADEGAGDR